MKSSDKGIDIAFMEDEKLVELHQETTSSQFCVGDIYLGKVKKVVPGLNAAFVDVGYEKDAFLHYTDLSPYIRSLLKVSKLAISKKLSDPMLKGFKQEPEIVKTGSINDVFKSNLNVFVQVVKEPISTKGPRLSCELSVPGRYMVLTPFNDTVGVSKKVATEEERKRLKVLVDSLKPKGFGVIVRTAAEGKKSAVLHDELLYLERRWKTMIHNAQGGNAPKKVLSELDKTTSMIRDLLNDSFNKIVTDDDELANQMQNYIAKVAPDRVKMVSQYKGKRPIFDHYGITKQIKSAFGESVSFGNGPYLIIQHTEAMHVIDVNSGHKVSKKDDQETNALRTNMEAAKEVARQLRLRDLGGIIVIDFIDMKKPDNKKAVYKAMKDSMANDRATHSILPLTKFNIMQITRQRVRPELSIKTSENCPACAGTGKINASILIQDDIERDIELVMKDHKKIKLVVHPYIQAYLVRGIRNKLKWLVKYKGSVDIVQDDNMPLTQYKFYDKNNELVQI